MMDGLLTLADLSDAELPESLSNARRYLLYAKLDTFTARSRHDSAFWLSEIARIKGEYKRRGVAAPVAVMI